MNPNSTSTKKLFSLLLMVVFFHAHALGNFSDEDTLMEKDFKFLQQNFFQNRSNQLKSSIYAKAWLAKAKTENDRVQVAMAYKALAYNADKRLKEVYIDSMVNAAMSTGQDAAIGAAYLTKGIALYEQLKHKNALDNYMIADRYISRTNDLEIGFKLKYQIAQTKYQLGYYDEAISLLRECITYYEEENDVAYLNSLYALSLCYTAFKEYDLSSYMNNVGESASRDFGLLYMLPYFQLSEGVNEYYKKNYTTAIKTLSEIMPALKADRQNVTVGNFYLGKSFWDTGDRKKAVPHFKLVVAMFGEKEYIRPDLLESYSLLIQYYKTKSDDKSVVFYMAGLLKADSVISADYKYLSGKILRKYNPKKIIEEKRDIESKMLWRTTAGSTLIVALSGTIGFMIYRHSKTRKRYHQKFRELMEKNKEGKVVAAHTPGPYNEKELGFNEELANELIKRLEEFEKEKEYIEHDMNLAKFSSKLNTNPKYATKILAHARGKGIIEYVSDLKIDYIVDKLHDDKRFRNYTNKALGDEVGFGSTQSFTKAFKSKIGIPPTIYIAELKSAAKRDTDTADNLA